ncbi:MAG: AAA family ATPase [Planctomycetota bacterium]
MSTETGRGVSDRVSEGVAGVAGAAAAVLAGLDRVLLGQSEVHRLVLTCVLARGHVLLEGLPGLGKTVMIRTLGDLLGLDFRRVQFTPDLMPGDVLGSQILQQRADGERVMEFHPGPVFTNVLLADEINRASPKTQSALLESMQEGRATVYGVTRELPSPFFVLASQNPIELAGTYPLPEAQLDRFLMKIEVGMPGLDVLEEIVATRHRGEGPAVEPVTDAAGLAALFAAVDGVELPRPVARYAARLVSATHAGSGEAPEAVRRFVKHGASPRAVIGLGEAARAYALLAGRASVGFEDVAALAPSVVSHRIGLTYEAGLDKMTPRGVVDALVASLPKVPDALPAGVGVEVGA